MINPSFWKGKRVFVTGHTGFKGSWLSIWLNYLGASVNGYALSPSTSPSLFNIAKVDNLTIGQEISGLNQWDIAFENGLIKGLLGKNFKVSEKLDYVKFIDDYAFIIGSINGNLYHHELLINFSY